MRFLLVLREVSKAFGFAFPPFLSDTSRGNGGQVAWSYIVPDAVLGAIPDGRPSKRSSMSLLSTSLGLLRISS